MDQEKHYRHELKYDIAFPDYLAMRERLRHIMKADPAGLASFYRLVCRFFRRYSLNVHLKCILER